ncbi:hypothetical protein [Actinomadura roseirufa]|uniref:hypothetical protein n=1 Tax=Actinomadura roseirufa TaxID=2094049 RepID=UPI001A955159|nr:hypothetical protein [Actinomadura roseirufa]
MTVPLAFVAVIVLIVAVMALVALAMRRRESLRRQFGPEYDRTVVAVGNRREAERQLVGRRSRVERLGLRPLDPAARHAYQAEWTHVQERFLDVPEDALSGADQLMRRVMADRGYGTQDYEQRVADLSVRHSRILDHYRSAHRINARAAVKRVPIGELRQATMHYRTLFEELLDDGTDGTEPSTAGVKDDPRRPEAADHPEDDREP